ncbi:MAG TPA: hypothetical protein EYP90_09245 [Chromatiaceae bacterium]|nr:hypothetical protein [Chromatiaceae bacterium]
MITHHLKALPQRIIGDSQSCKMTSLAHDQDTNVASYGWAPVFWEPVANTSECLMTGVIVNSGGRVTAHRILRDDVLQCLYGKAAEGARNLIDFSLEDLRLKAEHGGMNAVEGTVSGSLIAGNVHVTGQSSINDALRTAALMYSSMAAIDRFDELEAEDMPQPDEVNRRFAMEVREYVVSQHPDLSQCFGRKTEILPAGAPVSFGFCSPTLAAHFGTLHPVHRSAGVRDARAKLWELHRLREYTDIPNACLIIGHPEKQDPTLSRQQQASLEANLAEIEREADSCDMRMFPVSSAEQGGEKILQYHHARGAG